MIAIAGVGLCTAQGATRDILAGGVLAAPGRLPWPPGLRASCSIGFSARGIDPALRGAARWHALADAALTDLGGSRDVPVIAASCNGGADLAEAGDWAGAFATLEIAGPIASAACASGIHALWLGATRIAAGCDELIVLAVDALSSVNHDQFESLRVFSETPTPWQPGATGFLPGEAAVAIRLVRAREGDRLPRLGGPLLAHDLQGVDALAALVAVGPNEVACVLGQGTGPVAVDDRELAALAHLPLEIPISTPLAAFGHAIGASGLLSVALAGIARSHPIDALAMPGSSSDGRALGTTDRDGHPTSDRRGLDAPERSRGDSLVICRALGGACAVVRIGSAGTVPTAIGRPPPAWTAPAEPPALRMPVLRRISSEALAHRPHAPPAALVVRLDAPLVPPADARIGGRLLPSVVLEMTPGFIAQLVARAWGYGGPALCLVGGSDADWSDTLAACREVHGTTLVLHVGADGWKWDA